MSDTRLPLPDENEEAWADVYAADTDADDSFAEASALEAGARWEREDP